MYRHVAVLLASFAPAAAATTPCERGADLLPPIVAPADGSTAVPLNVKPIIARPTLETPARFLAGDVEIPHAAERFDVEDGFGTVEMTRLLPNEDLPARTEVRIELATGDVAVFTTGDGRDDVPPGAPRLERARDYAGGACTPFVEIPVSGDGDAALFIARTAQRNPELRGNANLNGMAVGEVIVVSGPASGELPVAVAAVDLAGNVGPASSIDVIFPDELSFPGGCSHLGGTTGPGAAGPAALGMIVGALIASAGRGARSRTPRGHPRGSRRAPPA